MSVIAELTSVGNDKIALKHVKIKSTLRGLCSETLISQLYCNLEAHAIEVVYTFPVPIDAVLLGLVLVINGKTMHGVVSAKKEAEETYEQAMDSGDTAVLLRQVEPGIYTVNIGNILSGENVEVRYRYSQLHHWQGNNLRFQLPTTIAPRYGNPEKTGFAKHEEPEYSMTVNHGFSLELRVEGGLANAAIECPSHPIGFSQENTTRVFKLAGGTALMNKDFVLIFKESEQSALQGYWCQDKNEYVALASFHPHYPKSIIAKPQIIKLVIDCSGSMSGDSIQQAKIAVKEILNLLRPDDQFNITTFGSHHQLLFSAPKLADRRNIQIAQQFIQQIDANMGGTEIASALDASYKNRSNNENTADLILITDGEVHDQETIIQQAQHSNHRIFSIGVGNAVSEHLVRGIAAVTGGACEMVAPNENMANHIIRQFERMRQPRASMIEVVWPNELEYQSPSIIKYAYSGDTLHFFARLKHPPMGAVILKMQYEDGEYSEYYLDLLAADNYSAKDSSFASILPRLAAYSRIKELNNNDAQALAVEYQLISDLTSCVLVYKRDDANKAVGIPALHKVPQMLPADAMRHSSYVPIPAFLRVMKATGAPAPLLSSFSEVNSPSSGGLFDIAAYLRRKTSSSIKPGRAISQKTPLTTLSSLSFNVLHVLQANSIKFIEDLIKYSALDLLSVNGLDEIDIQEIIQALSEKGYFLRQ